MSKYLNTSDARIRGGGGHVRVTCATNVGQGNGGTSLACSGCWVQPVTANTELVRMAIDVAASATVGMDLGRSEAGNSYSSVLPFWVPIDDVASLYFYSADTSAIIDIVYLVGGNE